MSSWELPTLSCWSLVIVFTIAILGYIYHKISRIYEHFELLNVPHRRPIFPYTKLSDLMLEQFSADDYKRFRQSSFYGVYHGLQPTLYVRDPDLIRKITHEHFEHFVDHMVASTSRMHNPDVEPFISHSLPALIGAKWHAMRQTLSPALSAGRIRQMFPLIAGCAQRTVQALREQEAAAVAENRYWRPDVADLMSRYANDVIATVAFGVETDSVRHPDNRFYRLAMRMMSFSSWRSWWRALLAMATVTLPAPLRWRFFDAEIVQYFGSLVLDGMRYRSEFGVQRADMVQMMMEARVAGEGGQPEAQVDPDSGEPLQEVGCEDMRGRRSPQWKDDECVAQSVMFFMTGYSTISTTLSFLLYELAVNRDVQLQLVAEVDAVRARLNDGPPQYGDLDEMRYMDAVIAETMRLWPTATLLHRQCAKDYVLRDARGNVVPIRCGETVCIPVAGIHRDPEYFAEPDRFRPDRFGEERKHEIRAFAYLPFGTGPRNCIGSRLAITELKAITFHLLAAFTLAPSATTRIPCKIRQNNGVFEIAGGLDIRLLPRHQ